jgi:sulfur-carrier protein
VLASNRCHKSHQDLGTHLRAFADKRKLANCSAQASPVEILCETIAVSNEGMIRVVLPHHLRNLAHVGSEVALEVAPPITQRRVLDALEAKYPMLRGTIRDHGTLERRAFLRFFACEEDLSHEAPDSPLPEAVASGKEPFIVIGAIAGG